MLRAASRFAQVTAIMALGLVASLVTVDVADARRGGGGFGSRGAKTFQAPAPTRTAPNTAAPIERTMTPNTGTNAQAARPAAGATAGAQKPGLFGGFGRSMLGGLVMGGLLGMLLGQGFGGMAGMLGMVVQIALFALLAMLAMRYFANRRQPAAAGMANNYRDAQSSDNAAPAANAGPNNSTGFGSFGGHTPSVNPFQTKAAAPVVEETPIDVGQADLDQFEQMLVEVQGAYGREDYATLRELATPEAMSYLAEELGEIASKGKRNSVTDVKLLQGDISEAWSEGENEYATVALRYSSIDVMLDRNTGAVVEGNPKEASEAVELWTFVRKNGGAWKLSAIQDAS